MNYKTLFRSHYFAPIFWTQFLGAFNDNIYKNTLIILITYQSAAYSNLSADILIPLSASVFILPFFLSWLVNLLINMRSQNLLE